VDRIGTIPGRTGKRAAGAHESGQALVETALTMPILLFMLVGAFELGQVAYVSIEVANSAKAAVQYGAQNPGTSAQTAIMQTLAVNEAADYGISLNTPIGVTSSCSCVSGGSATANPSCGACPSGNYPVHTLTVTTSAPYTPVFHIPGIGPSFTVRGRAVQEVLF
jgi:Flp pilus assembly protein TadG